MNKNLTFSVAEVDNPKDGKPVVKSYTIEQFVAAVSKAPISATTYEAYHQHKADEKRLSIEARAARAAGDKELAEKLKLSAKNHRAVVNNAKFSRGVMPFIYKGNRTFKEVINGWAQRDNSAITHFSLVMLDIESNTTEAEIHDVLKDYEYVLWTTITHRADDLRYRVVLFPEQPIPNVEAQALIMRIDAHLPDRNDPSKKTQCIDYASADVGRLMFFPRWLSDHPLRFHHTHNTGKLLTPNAFPLSEERQALVDQRVVAADSARKAKTATNIARATSLTGAASLIIERKNKSQGENDWLNPTAEFETEDGWVTLKDVDGKITGVRCPFHADNVGSDFLSVNRHSGRPQFVCHSCGVFKMFPHVEEQTPEESLADSLKLFKKPKAETPETVATVRERSRNTPSVTLYDDGEPVKFLDERYLQDFNAMVPDRGMLFVRSPKGTGKTEGIVRLVEESKRAGKSVLLLTHRISLARNLSVRTGLYNYQDLPQGEKLPDHVVICVNSLKSKLDEVAADYDLVIIDESEQVLRNLLADTLKNILSDVFTKIAKLLRNANRVVCLDADLSTEMTLELIAELRTARTENEPLINDDDKYVGIVNDYKIGKGRSVKVMQSNYELLYAITQEVERGEKVFVTCSTAHAAMTIGEIVKSMDKRVLIIHSGTSNTDPDAIAFTASPQSEASKYDVVVTSPSLQTGFSIDGNYFTRVFGWFKSVDGITFQDFDQALSRVRNCDDVTVWIQHTELKVQPDPPEVFIQHALSKEYKTRKRLPTERTINAAEHLWAKIEGTINYLVKVWSDRRDEKFKEMKRDLGFEIIELPKDKQAFDEGKALWSIFKDLGGDRAAKVLAAFQLDPDQYLQVKQKRSKTKDDSLALERFRIQEVIGLDVDLTLDMVERAIKENMVATVWRIRKVILSNDQYRENSDDKDRERHHTAFTRASHITMEHDLLVKVLAKAAGIDIEALYSRVNAGEEVQITDAVLDTVLDTFMNRIHEFKHYFELRIGTTEGAEDEQKARVARRKRVWDGTFGKYGLPLIRKQRGPRESRIRQYFIDGEKMKQTINVVAAN